jgi:hypothetical protein
VDATNNSALERVVSGLIVGTGNHLNVIPADHPGAILATSVLATGLERMVGARS